MDWRLNGLVSRLIAEEADPGISPERVLIESQRRIPPQKIVLFGLGKRGGAQLRYPPGSWGPG